MYAQQSWYSWCLGACFP